MSDKCMHIVNMAPASDVNKSTSRIKVDFTTGKIIGQQSTKGTSASYITVYAIYYR